MLMDTDGYNWIVQEFCYPVESTALMNGSSLQWQLLRYKNK